MSKFLNVPNGDYKVSVKTGGTIYLDTGFEIGAVIISGNLTVQGTTTTVESTTTTIADNIITLNSGETGAGISALVGSTSGIQIDRGSRPDAFFVYDEDLNDPINPLSPGLFVFKTDGGTAKGIRTNAISTGGGDLLLVGSGAGVVTVTGTVNYEANVTDDDDLTNKKYVDDAIDTAFATVFLSQIGDGVDTITSITIQDEESTGLNSVINFAIDAVPVSKLYADRWEFQEIRIVGTTIETLTSDSDLVLKAPGIGAVRIDDTLHINSVPETDDDLTLEPAAPTDGAKIYVATEYTGNTGIYFVNAQQTRDELISKNRSLLFSMLF
jgi:hypothetical protein